MHRMIRVMKNCCPLSNWHLVNFIRFGLTRNSVAFRTGEMQPEADDTSSGRTEAGATAPLMRAGTSGRK